MQFGPGCGSSKIMHVIGEVIMQRNIANDVDTLACEHFHDPHEQPPFDHKSPFVFGSSLLLATYGYRLT
eukprot:COSAG02_NODE_54_length_43941_cov_54.857990_17_plen_69_part_00